MRGTAQTLRRHMAAHRRLWLAAALGLAGVVVLVGGALYFAGPGNSSIAIVPAARYDTRWTFRELQHQLDAGQVISVTVARNAQNQPSLLANVADGKVAAIYRRMLPTRRPRWWRWVIATC